MRRLAPMILSSLSLISFGWAHSSIARAADLPNLSGTWILNEKASDDPAEKMREAMRSQGGSGGRRGGGPLGGGHGGLGAGGADMGAGADVGGGGETGGAPMGEGGMGGGRMGGGMGSGRRMGGGEGRSDADRGALRERMKQREAGAKSLEITHAEPHLTVRNANGDTWSATTDGKKAKVHGVEGTDTEIAAQWQTGGRLVVSQTPDSGPRITETYELVAEGKRLLVKVHFEGAGRMASGFDLQRVYDRQPGGEPGAAPAAPAAPPSGAGG